MRKRIVAELPAKEPTTAEHIARYVVAEAVWAPSVHNTQPWRFVADGRQISLYADADRGLPMADPDGREMMISCGAALFNAQLALRSLGYIPQTRVLPDPDQPTLVAQVGWRHRAPASEFEQLLASQVRRRRTYRGAFDPEPLPHGTLAALRGTAARDGVGQVLQRVLLTASTCGAAVALHTQPVELPWLREYIRTHLSDGAYPHLVLRIGMVIQAAESVRRDADDVLLSLGGGHAEPGRW